MEKLIEILLSLGIWDEVAVVGWIAFLGGWFVVIVSVRYYLKFAWKHIFNPLRRR